MNIYIYNIEIEKNFNNIRSQYSNITHYLHIFVKFFH